MAQQAQDTFVVTMPDGSDHFVAKGQVLPDGHVVVKHAPGLFARLDMGEADEKPPAKSGPAKAAAKEPEADVKPAVKAPAAPKAAGRG